jgi:hypothetical protein
MFPRGGHNRVTHLQACSHVEINQFQGFNFARLERMCLILTAHTGEIKLVTNWIC